MDQLQFVKLNSIDDRAKYLSVQNVFCDHSKDYDAIQRQHIMKLQHIKNDHYRGNIPKKFDAIGQFFIYHCPMANIYKVQLTYRDKTLHEKDVHSDNRDNRDGSCRFKFNEDPIDIRNFDGELCLNVFFDRVYCSPEKIKLCMEVFIVSRFSND